MTLPQKVNDQNTEGAERHGEGTWYLSGERKIEAVMVSVKYPRILPYSKAGSMALFKYWHR